MAAAWSDLRTAARVARREGLREVGRRGVRTLYERLRVDELEFPLLPGDLADSQRDEPPARPAARASGSRLRVAWICTPPGLGSGGHTTMFRMVTALERAGHECTVLLYDRYGGSAAKHEAVIRQGWPEVRAEVRDVGEGTGSFDVCVATSWPTAHVLARRGSDNAHRAYLIQDFEPFFTGHGSEYELALDTYRLGFHNIALGQMVHGRLSEIGVDSSVVDFGCDTDVYRVIRQTSRSGVVFHARPGASRRGYVLGSLALARFHTLHPEQPIHVYGSRVDQLPFPAEQHGRLAPTELNALYNGVVAGLALSFTNISLVAEEMLAAGAVPVINDSADSRADLQNPYAAWAPPTPAGLARTLSAVVSENDLDGRSTRAAHSVRHRSWRRSGEQLVDIVERIAWGSCTSTEKPGAPGLDSGSGAAIRSEHGGPPAA